MSTSWLVLLFGVVCIYLIVEVVRASLCRADGMAQNDRESEKSNTRWIQSGEKVVVAGRSINGMIYLGSTPAIADESFIDPSLSVAKVGGDASEEALDYWPCYCDLDSQQRASYLDWLAGGRSSKKYGKGYVFLYFYGLERRFFIDSPVEEEKRQLIAEVERLLNVYGDSHSIRRHLEDFLDIARVVLDPTGEIKPQFDLFRYELPLTMRIAIGRMVKEECPLNADWLLSWYVTSLRPSLRTPATRAFPEFRALFNLLFDERFPNGMKIYTSKQIIHAHYTAASGAFEANLDSLIGDLPDVTSTSEPLDDVREIVESATNQLDKYSRFLGRNPEGRDTIEAHALLPKRLWPLFPCGEMERLSLWATEIIEQGGIVPVEQIIERFEGMVPEKIRKQQLTGVADALARLSIGMAPDPRYALRGPKIGEPVVLFQLPEEADELEEVGQAYRNILVSMTLGSFIAHADGTVTEGERDSLEDKVKTADVSETERARLYANLQWMLEVPTDLNLFRRHLKDLPENTRHEFGQIALAMAAVDGAIDPKEIKAIKRLYKAMGLGTEGMYSDLHALASGGGPVMVREASKMEKDFAIPPPTSDNKITLDTKRVASIMANTERVSSILGEIFGDDESDGDMDETSQGGDERFPGLDTKHSDFLNELLTRTYWAEAEFAALASQFRLMHGGALETVNEWAFERFDDMLIEAYQGYTINQEIKTQLES